MGRYSYSQPSLSDSNESLRYRLENDFSFEEGIPKVCFCGRLVLLDTCRTDLDPGRRFYTCSHSDDGNSHIWKWWDSAITEDVISLKDNVAEIQSKLHFLNGHESPDVTFDVNAAKSQIGQIQQVGSEIQDKLTNMENQMRAIRLQLKILVAASIFFFSGLWIAFK